MWLERDCGRFRLECFKSLRCRRGIKPASLALIQDDNLCSCQNRAFERNTGDNAVIGDEKASGSRRWLECFVNAAYFSGASATGLHSGLMIVSVARLSFCTSTPPT